MGLQKYRFDQVDGPEPNGSIALRTVWMGGPSLAGVRNCPSDDYEGVRTVYITGEPDTYYSTPAAVSIKGKTVRGWVGYDPRTGFYFSANKGG